MSDPITHERSAMSIDVRVPATGNAGEDAVISGWSVVVGSRVSAGDILVTLETAKAAVEVEAPADGEVLELLFGEGDEVAEHAVIAIIGDPASAKTAAPRTPTPDAAVSDTAVSDAATSHTVELNAMTRAALRTDDDGARVRASPRAMILAQRNGVDLNTITGSGPSGRIITADVLAERNRLRDAGQAASVPSATPAAPVSTAASAPAAAAETTSATESGAESCYELVPVRGARKVTAQRMQSSLQGAAQVTLTRYADAGAMDSYIARLRTITDAQSLPKIGLNDALLFAAAKALSRHPEANATFDWDGIRRFRSVNLGFAVDTGQALLVPVIPAAERMSLAQLSAVARAHIEKARAGKLTTPEMEGGTFTVSNLGSLGVHWFTPVLNAPQACILGVGATHQSHPDGPHLLPLSLTFDHRALDGAAAAAVLADIARCIETIDVLSAF